MEQIWLNLIYEAKYIGKSLTAHIFINNSLLVIITTL